MDMFLQQNNAVWFYPKPMAYLVSGSWMPKQCLEWVPSHEVGLKYQQKEVDVFPQYDTIGPTYHKRNSLLYVHKNYRCVCG